MPKTKPQKKKKPGPKPAKKPFQKARGQERSMKAKSLADFVAKKAAEKVEESLFNTLAQENLICPFCGWDHDPEDLNLRKRANGLVKCSDCGEAFEFEALRKVVYTTSVP